MRKKAQAKRKQAQESTDDSAQIKKMMSGVRINSENNFSMKYFQNYQFTDLEIMTLWNSFRIDFPEGQLSSSQLQDVVRRVFPKLFSILIKIILTWLLHLDVMQMLLSTIFSKYLILNTLEKLLLRNY